MNIQGWFPLGLTGWISLQSKGLSTVFSSTTVWSISSSVLSLLYSPTHTSIHDYWKTIALTIELYIFSLLQSHSLMSASLLPHGLQHTRLPYPSLTTGVYSITCPLSWWCHPTISSCHPLLLLPSIFPSIRVFSNDSALRIRWPKYWSFSFSISPSNEYSGLISFRMDWLGLLAVQGTLKSLLQYHSLKASILQRSAFFVVQLSHPYRTTGKTIAMTRWTFVGKVMSLPFNMLSRLVITFLPRSKRLLISWLQSPSAVILEPPPPQIKSVTVSIASPSICHEVMGPDAMILVFWMLSFKPTFSLSSFTFIKRLFNSSSLSAIKDCVICISEVIDISPGNLDSSLCFFQPSISQCLLNACN